MEDIVPREARFDHLFRQIPLPHPHPGDEAVVAVDVALLQGDLPPLGEGCQVPASHARKRLGLLRRVDAFEPHRDLLPTVRDDQAVAVLDVDDPGGRLGLRGRPAGDEADESHEQKKGREERMVPMHPRRLAQRSRLSVGRPTPRCRSSSSTANVTPKNTAHPRARATSSGEAP